MTVGSRAGDGRRSAGLNGSQGLVQGSDAKKGPKRTK